MNQLFDPQHELGRVLISLREAFVQAAVFSFFINMLLLVPALYMLQIYDRVITSRNATTLVLLTVIMIVAYVVMGFMEWVRSSLLIRIGTKLDTELNERVFTAAFQRYLYRMGGNPHQAMADLGRTRQFLAGSASVAFFDAPWAPIYLAVITLIDPWLGAFSLVSMVILAFLAWLNELVTHKALAEANTHATQAALFANNNLRNSEAIQAMGMLPSIRGRWSELHGKSMALQILASERGGLVASTTKAARITFQSLILGFGGYLAIIDVITPGGMIAASILLGRALAPVEQLIAAWKQWLGARASYDRLSELLSRVPEPGKATELPPPTGTVNIEGASAVPPGAKEPVLKNLAIRIQAGDVVAVIGPSAAGKSSLARLITGIWPPSTGHVRLDSVEVFQWNKTELGPHIGYLPQDIELFEGTVAENIARFGEPNSEKIVAAARIAGVHDMILRLPKGYETPVGADGAALSGGQRQRVGLARALYGEPKLIVLDEPNSNLDDIGEAALAQAISELKKQGRTVIFVSHGPQLLAVADKLLVLREGQLVAYGPRDAVLEHLRNPQPALAAGAPR
jgi:ATP-binding cassette subfamily C exporter for protease/lipase